MGLTSNMKLRGVSESIPIVLEIRLIRLNKS